MHTVLGGYDLTLARGTNSKVRAKLHADNYNWYPSISRTKSIPHYILLPSITPYPRVVYTSGHCNTFRVAPQKQSFDLGNAGCSPLWKRRMSKKYNLLVTRKWSIGLGWLWTRHAADCTHGCTLFCCIFEKFYFVGFETKLCISPAVCWLKTKWLGSEHVRG